MTINASAAVLLALYVAVAEKQEWREARSAVQLRTTSQGVHRRGTYIFPPRPSMRLVTDVFEFCSKELRAGTPSASAAITCASGCDCSQELAFTLADGIAYVEAALSRGLTSMRSPTGSVSLCRVERAL